MPFGQFAATTQFYLYGRKHFTRTGWEAASKTYVQPDVLTTLDLRGKCFMVTGANQGIGYEITRYLASRGGRVFMVCRNPARAEAARASIVENLQGDTRAGTVGTLICDCSVEDDVRSMWQEFGKASTKLDGLVCNAGALLNDKTLTAAGIETTFAAHLLFGSYLMTQLALPFLSVAVDPRVVLVSSGGMLNVPFPPWEVATSQTGNYDGQLAYAYAKRAQVLLCERWSTEHRQIKFVSAHPGWTATSAVDVAYGDKKSYLEPMRSTWEGAEGICWLATCAGSELQSGEFYLDRAVQVKHMAGAFFSEGSYTKNSEAEVERMCDSLECWANGRAGEVPKPLPAATLKEPIPPMEGSIDLPSFMGRWYVIASIPTWFEKGATNCVEEYVWEELPEGNGRVGVTFSYNKAGSSSRSEMLQRATISNAPSNTVWAVSPKTLGVYVPLGLGYIIAHVQPDYSWVIVSLSDRSNFWLMTRSPLMQADDYRIALRRADALGFNMAKVIKVHHDASVGVGSGGEKAAAGVEPEPEPAPPILQQHTLPSVFDASRDSFPAGESPDSPALEGASAEAVTPETEEDEGFTAL